MNISPRLVMRQILKCVFWPISLPVILGISLTTPFFAFLFWVADDTEYDDDTLWHVIKETCNGYYLCVKPLVVNESNRRTS